MQCVTPSGCLQVGLPLCQALALQLAAAWSKSPWQSASEACKQGGIPMPSQQPSLL